MDDDYDENEEDLNSTVVNSKGDKRPNFDETDDQVTKVTKENENLSKNLMADKQLILSSQTFINHLPSDNHLMFAPSMVLNDLSKLKKRFGLFMILNSDNLDPETWISNVKNNLEREYPSPNDIIDQFFIFLHKDYHPWFFKLDKNIKKGFNLFKDEFLKESKRQHFDQFSMCLMKQNDFVNKLKEKFDTKINLELSSNPIYSYFKYKFMSIKQCFLSIKREEMVLMAINLLDSKENQSKIFSYRKLDLKDFLIFCQNLDLVQKLD